MWTRFLWLTAMTFGDIWPAYLLVAVLPAVAAFRGTTTAAYAVLAALALHAGPLAMLVWGASMYGASTHAFSWIEVVQLAMAALGIALAVAAARPIRRDVPRWAFIAFFAGAAIINLMTLFVSGMALTDDWV